MSELRVAARAPSFFDLYSSGEATADDMDDLVGRWQDDLQPWARNMRLHEYLRLCHKENEKLLCDPFALPAILQARQTGESLADVTAQRDADLRVADRTILFSLGNWLKAQSRH